MALEDYLICVLGMGLVTYIPRWAPLAYLTGRNIPPVMVEWLRFIPASILSALIFPSILIDTRVGGISLFRSEFIVAIPTFFIALKTKSLALTVITGMMMYYFADKFL
ncbi:MAG: AzlD domain-containing protein [Desulfomonilia bacterium]